MTRLTEDQLISRFFAPLATLAGARGLTDDAAVLSVPAGRHLVVTADMLVAGVHFLADDAADLVARKSLRVNLSDLAAKGARPHAFTLSLALPAGWTDEWLALFAEGLARDAAAFSFSLLGGDTVRTPGPLTIAVTAFGLVPAADIPRRDGARAGDAVYVSGTIGDGALGLLTRTGRDAFADRLGPEDRAFLTGRYLLPEPRVALAPALLAHASATMDVSDGFVGDLAKLLRASGVSATIDLSQVPLSAAARRAVAGDAACFETALTGGDDYEILCTVPPSGEEAFVGAAKAARIDVTRVGVVTEEAGPPRFIAPGGADTRFARGSFSHF
ncbi:thiamine-phosphate kinase [Labrys monachus]|uniref:Thiamine-monophosphate kinase n=1 Tax=Labrys monachus TaxID=217067 RepID=A0ABU0FKF4_9HYPH|nr:thiamine-phosphate kinase [Labrys monachus]MDQ0395094.1 thiamine-monophosphate kinase [Labrys monachus]